MRTNQIYIARDGKSGMHVLVRILAVDDIGKDYLPIDPDDFNKLMMARDVRSLVLAARDLGPMYISADVLSRRIFIPSHLQQPKSATNGSTHRRKPELSVISNTVEIRILTKSRKKTRTIICAAR